MRFELNFLEILKRSDLCNSISIYFKHRPMPMRCMHVYNWDQRATTWPTKQSTRNFMKIHQKRRNLLIHDRSKSLQHIILKWETLENCGASNHVAFYENTKQKMLASTRRVAEDFSSLVIFNFAPWGNFLHSLNFRLVILTL